MLRTAIGPYPGNVIFPAPRRTGLRTTMAAQPAGGTRRAVPLSILEVNPGRAPGRGWPRRRPRADLHRVHGPVRRSPSAIPAIVRRAGALTGSAPWSVKPPAPANPSCSFPTPSHAHRRQRPAAPRESFRARRPVGFEPTAITWLCRRTCSRIASDVCGARCGPSMSASASDRPWAPSFCVVPSDAWSARPAASAGASGCCPGAASVAGPWAVLAGAAAAAGRLRGYRGAAGGSVAR